MTLSGDQRRFVDVLSDGTGLEPDVVKAWVTSRSAAGAHEHGHDYIGGGLFPSAGHAGAWWAKYVRDRRPEVMGARAVGPLQQLKAIANDPALPSGTYPQLVTHWAAHRGVRLQAAAP